MYYVCNHDNIRAFLFIKDKLVRVDTFLKKKLKANTRNPVLIATVPSCVISFYLFIFFFHFDAFIFMQRNFTLYVQPIKKGGFQLRTTCRVLLFSVTKYETENSTQGNFIP